MLPDIEGLKMSDGLARLGGNDRLYRRLLQSFAEQCETTVASFQSALEAGDSAHLRWLAHKLKGVAGGLGAAEVERLALSLEHTAGEEVLPEYEALAGSLRETSGRILQGLKDWLEPPLPPSAALPTEQLWEKLQAELQSFDAEVLDTWSLFAPRLQGLVPAEELEQLEKLVLIFDFPSVLKRLKRLNLWLG